MEPRGWHSQCAGTLFSEPAIESEGRIVIQTDCATAAASGTTQAAGQRSLAGRRWHGVPSDASHGVTRRVWWQGVLSSPWRPLAEAGDGLVPLPNTSGL